MNRRVIAVMLVVSVLAAGAVNPVTAQDDSTQSPQTNATTSSASADDEEELRIGVIDRRQADASDLSSEQRIRPGQWLISSDFDYSSETVELTFYSNYDADMAIADSNDVGREGAQKIDVLNFDIAAGEAVTVRADASVMTDIAGISTDQTVTVNSFDTPTDSSNLAAISVSDDSVPLTNSAAQWSFVWVAGAGVVSLGLFAVLLAFIWHWFQSPKDELDLYDMGGR
jgi:hypothetical protein